MTTTLHPKLKTKQNDFCHFSSFCKSWKTMKRQNIVRYQMCPWLISFLMEAVRDRSLVRGWRDKPRFTLKNDWWRFSIGFFSRKKTIKHYHHPPPHTPKKKNQPIFAIFFSLLWSETNTKGQSNVKEYNIMPLISYLYHYTCWVAKKRMSFILSANQLVIKIFTWQILEYAINHQKIPLLGH